MSNSRGCGNCPRQPYFSRDGQSISLSDGSTFPLGDAQNDNARQLRNYAPTVAAYKGSGSGPTFTPSSDPICFSSNNVVQVQGRGLVPIGTLEIGDYVQTSPKSYSRVYSFAHRDHKSMGDYLRIHAGPHVIEISQLHFLFVNKQIKAALSVRVGDILDCAIFSPVTKVERVKRRGLFAPLTESGEIEVSGVRASNYVSLLDLPPALQAQVFHAVLSPLRLACRFSSICEQEVYHPDGLSDRIAWLIWFAAALSKYISTPLLVAGTLLVSPVLAGATVLERVLLSPTWFAMFFVGCVLRSRQRSEKVCQPNRA